MSHRLTRVASEQALGAMFDLAAPQPNYKTLVENGGWFEPMEGMALSFNREDTEFVLKSHQLFTSRVEMNLGNVRPLIPLNVDPPKHSKYRKLLDPLFRPGAMNEQEQDITDGPTGSSIVSSTGASATSARSSPNCSPLGLPGSDGPA